MKIGDLVEHSASTGPVPQLIGHKEDFKAGLITEVRHPFCRVMPVGKIEELWYSKEELRLINKG